MKLFIFALLITLCGCAKELNPNAVNYPIYSSTKMLNSSGVLIECRGCLTLEAQNSAVRVSFSSADETCAGLNPQTYNSDQPFTLPTPSDGNSTQWVGYPITDTGQANSLCYPSTLLLRAEYSQNESAYLLEYNGRSYIIQKIN